MWTAATARQAAQHRVIDGALCLSRRQPTAPTAFLATNSAAKKKATDCDAEMQARITPDVIAAWRRLRLAPPRYRATRAWDADERAFCIMIGMNFEDGGTPATVNAAEPPSYIRRNRHQAARWLRLGAGGWRWMRLPGFPMMAGKSQAWLTSGTTATRRGAGGALAGSIASHSQQLFWPTG